MSDLQRSGDYLRPSKNLSTEAHTYAPSDVSYHPEYELQQSGLRPAHPLPEHRNEKLDYDRYLQQPTQKFKIFSAEEQRRRNRSIIIVVVIALVAAAIVIWAILSQNT